MSVRALECYNCTRVSEPRESVADGDDCPACESTDTFVVELQDCPVGAGCTHDDHHFGVGKHVIEIDR